MKPAVSSLRSDDPQRLIRLLALALILIALAFTLISPIFSLRLTQAPFLGAFFWPRLIASSSFNPDWEAIQLGLQMGDALKAVDDVPNPD